MRPHRDLRELLDLLKAIAAGFALGALMMPATILIAPAGSIRVAFYTVLILQIVVLILLHLVAWQARKELDK